MPELPSWRKQGRRLGAFLKSHRPPAVPYNVLEIVREKEYSFSKCLPGPGRRQELREKRGFV